MGLMRAWAAGALLLLLLPSAAAWAAPEAALAPLAHSAALTLEGARVPGALIVRVRASNPAAPATISGLSAALDGQALAVNARADGSWRLSLPPAPASGPGQLEVRISHDGITELLSAKLPAVAAQESGGSGIHNQLFWWVLNIAIVLIAALAISRRTS
jgi:hypothetical protein